MDPRTRGSAPEGAPAAATTTLHDHSERTAAVRRSRGHRGAYSAGLHWSGHGGLCPICHPRCVCELCMAVVIARAA